MVRTVTPRPPRPADLADVVRQPGAVLVVEGAAGIGKSRLVREVLRHLGPDVLTGRCLPTRASFPYGPVVDVLRGLRVDGSALSPVAGVLAELVPELTGSLPPFPAGGSNAHKVARAVREVLAGRGVLVVEDLQWADEATTDLLRYLVDEPPPGWSLLVTSRRPVTWLRTPPGRPRALVRLRPLDRDGLRVLAGDVLGSNDIPAEFLDELHRRTGGVPVVAEHVLRASADPGVVPLSLRDAVVEQLADLGADVTAMVRAAAVIDEPATEADLAAVSALAPRRAAKAITTAVAEQLLTEVRNGQYLVRVPLVRQAVYASTPGPQRRVIHERAARTARNPRRRAAHHRRAGEHDAWVRWTQAALAEADSETAIRLLDDALADPLLPRTARNAFAVRLSREALTGIAHQDTVGRLRAAVADGSLGRSARGEVRLNLGRLLINQAGQLAAGQAQVELALTELRDRPALLARGMAALALPSFGSTPVHVQLDWLRAAEEAATAIADPEVLTAVLANRMSALMATGDTRVWAEVAALPRPAGSVKVRRQLARAYLNLADSATWIGHYDTARDYLEQGRLLAGDGSFLPVLGDGTALRLGVAVGEWATLEPDGERLIDQAGEMTFLAADAWLALGWLALWRGDRAAALARFDGAIAAAHDNVPVLISARTGRAAAFLAAGDFAAAGAAADRAAAQVRRKGNWVWAAELVPVATRALLRGDRLDDARALVTEYAAGITARDAPLAVAALDDGLGALAQAEGGHRAALDHFTRAAHRYAALPHPRWSAQAAESAAQSAAALGAVDVAATHWITAADTYATLGATRDATRCRAAARPHTESRRGRRGYGTTLSPREREVAALAVTGLTNREIADRLVLSQRTVEQHVAGAMRKLGVHSRTALSEG
ncbi:ATP-binding protein [Actinokineospora globicatena]|uniref:ATP-binding protein n=1 Tax=Actinokineospora globicatena TaxID=103729 RepID=UPI0031CF5665